MWQQRLFFALLATVSIGALTPPTLANSNTPLMSPRSVSSLPLAQASSSDNALAGVGDSLKETLWNQNGLIVLACGLGMAGLSFFGGKGGPGKKNRLATGQWAGGKEKSAARNKARQQLNDRQRNAVTLFIGQPTTLQYLPSAVSKPRKARPTAKGKRVVKVKGDTATTWIPDAQRGVAVMGGPGSGKTFSVIDPALRSVIDQGFPLVLYDFKYPTQSERIAAVAAKAGYEVRVFAPGFPESDICNPLDFIRDADDVDMARQIAIVLNRNFKSGGQSVEDPFFTNSGDQLIQAILLLAKSTPFPDIITCAKALSSDNLPGRVQNADLPTWVESSFGQLISMADSEKTVASVISTASILFSRFMSPSTLSVFCGKTTIPLDMEGKQLLILGMDRERRDVVAPLLATVLHMLVTRNVAATKRKDPLCLALDELPTLYLPNLVQWLNENREDGLATILGFQNMTQLEKAYGREISRAILGGCATKAIFNPGEPESAKFFSDYLGDEHLQYKSRSKSTGGGKSNTTTSQQERTRKLCGPEEFLKLPPGNCILINPAYGGKQETSVPLRLRIRIPKADMKRMETSQGAWNKVKARLIKTSTQKPIDQVAMDQRKQYFFDNYPLPTKPDPNAEATVNWGVANGFL
jgi:type IV secretory pathway TraG/TraD family ATPase VirD4